MKKYKVQWVALLVALGVFFCSCAAEQGTETRVQGESQASKSDSSDSLQTSNIQSSETEPAVPLALEYSTSTFSSDKALLLNTESLYYTNVLGIRRRDENSLPVVVGFEYPYVFYSRMSVNVEGAPEEAANIYMGRYSIETFEVTEIPIEDFRFGTYESKQIVNEEKLAYMYCAGDDTGQLMMKILMLDFGAGTKELLYSTASKNVFGYARKLDSEQLVFMMYPMDAAKDETRQIILNYNMTTGTVREIYRTEPLDWKSYTGSTKNIWSMDTDEGKLYLISHQFTDRKMKTFLDVLDGDGKILDVQELTALAAYDTKADVAEFATVKGSYIFLHYDQRIKGEGNDNAPFVILGKTDSGYRLIDTDGIYPDRYCGGEDSREGLLYFSIYQPPDVMYGGIIKDELFAFDVNEDSAAVGKIGLHGAEGFIGDAAGNLIIYTRGDSGVSNWYFVSQSDIAALA